MSSAGRREVQTQGGRLRSASAATEAVQEFRGVPFAKPPLGDRRWRAAEAPDPWDGVRDASTFAPAPVQSQPPTRTIMYQSNFADAAPLVMSEDCLYLNVWTPSLDVGEGLPIIVWVPGGGNRFGSGSQALYDGRRLASRGAVVVSLSYRVGALGFLAHPELTAESEVGASGNYALTDILAALRWVQDNGARFGGDPGRVTLVGNSAGARHVSHLMASPAAAGLFSQAVGQSGAGFDGAHRRMSTLADAEADGLDFAKGRSVDHLRELAAVDVSLGLAPEAVIDGWLLPTSTEAAFLSGRQMAIPLLVGTNADEGAVHAGAQTAETFRRGAELYGDLADPFLDLYPVEPPGDLWRSNRRSFGDARFVWPVWKWATTHARTAHQPVWMYRFEQPPPVPGDLGLRPPADGGDSFGAYHTAELFYMWDNLAVRPWAWTQLDAEIADLMATAWVRFAASGDPSVPGRLVWPPMADHPDGPVLYIGPRTALGPVPDPAAMGLHDQLNDQLSRHPTPS